MDLKDPRKPWLIQRVQARETPRPNGKGVDLHFSMDYMGSSEFEYGALPNSLKEMRRMVVDGKLLGPVQIKGNLPDGTSVACWYLGTQEYLEVAEFLFQKALKDAEHELRLKERTGILHTYTAKDPEHHSFVGWWCVDFGDRPRPNKGTWAIFHKKEDAKNWLKGLGSK